jgi:CYTH domain-containing protein
MRRAQTLDGDFTESRGRNPDLKMVCLTGGPCSGKSSSMSVLSDVLENRGWKVYRSPEAATVLLPGGISFYQLSPAQVYEFQRHILRVVLSLENTYLKLGAMNAERGIKTCILTDRGALDGGAYMPRDEWLKLLAEEGFAEGNLREERYDAIVHLTTAAKGAEAFFQTANNTARTETKEMAIELDQKTMNTWVGHPALDVIDNSTDFAGKLDRIVRAVMSRIGEEDASSVHGKTKKRKFLVLDPNFKLEESFPVTYRDFDVDHIYLREGEAGVQTRLRKRVAVDTGFIQFTSTTQHTKPNGDKVETRRNLSRREFEAQAVLADPTRVVITKRRRCFAYKDRYFQVDVFKNPCNGLVMLEGYLEENDAMMADFLAIKEVTSSPDFSMYQLAKKDAPTDAWRLAKDAVLAKN